MFRRQIEKNIMKKVANYIGLSNYGRSCFSSLLHLNFKKIILLLYHKAFSTISNYILNMVAYPHRISFEMKTKIQHIWYSMTKNVHWQKVTSISY